MVLDRFKLDGRTAVVTGGAAGLGQAFALALAEVGAKVAIVDRDPRILTEMGAKVEFLQAPRTPAAGADPGVERPRIIVPAEAVRSENGRDKVWIIRDGRLHSRDVDAGPVSGNFREIRSGLSGGEQLLVGGVETPREGQRVKTAP